MDRPALGRIPKSLIIVGSSVTLGALAYAVYVYWNRKYSKSIDEGFEDVARLPDSPEKRILLLGLEYSGKSTLLSQVACSSRDANTEVIPTVGFNVTCLHSGGLSLNIWEIGGKENMRCYWGNFLQDTDLLVYVIDAADQKKMPLAITEMKKLLGDERLAHVPVLVLANKQDLHGALTPEEVAQAIDIESVPLTKHKIKVIGTQTSPDVIKRHPSVEEVEKAFIAMSKGVF